MKLLSGVFLLLGMAFLAAAFLYPRMVAPQSLWSEEKAQERIEAGNKVHGLAHSQDNSQKKETLDRYEKIQAELEAARDWPQRVSNVLQWLGIAATALGVVAYFLSSREE